MSKAWMQISKKEHLNKKPNRKEEGHWEGKHWCNCRTRNYRTWLGKKKGLYGLEAIDQQAEDSEAAAGQSA